MGKSTLISPHGSDELKILLLEGKERDAEVKRAGTAGDHTRRSSFRCDTGLEPLCQPGIHAWQTEIALGTNPDTITLSGTLPPVFLP